MIGSWVVLLTDFAWLAIFAGKFFVAEVAVGVAAVSRPPEVWDARGG
jgi:hypothetical protein